jgi:regulator of sigma E protease
MVIFLWILLTLVVFSVVVYIHELGHFWVARKTGVRVDEFGIGIPPKAKSLFRDKKGTEYTLNWLPIGGFVRLYGEDDTHKKDTQSYASKSYWAKSAILLAGVTMNFLLAIFILFVLMWEVTNPSGLVPIGVNTRFQTETRSLLVPSLEDAKEVGMLTSSGVYIEPVADSVAEKAGVQKGDTIVSINSQKIIDSKQVADMIGSSSGTITLGLLRDNQEVTRSVTPVNGKIWVYIGDNLTYNKAYVISYWFVDALWNAIKETSIQSKLTIELLGSLIRRIVAPATPTERKEATESLTGPIWLGNLFVNLVENQAPVALILAIMALISVNLGVFNLLPFPALDGGRFVALTIHELLSKLTKGKIQVGKIEAKMNFVGFALLMLMSLFVAYKDILRIIHN